MLPVFLGFFLTQCSADPTEGNLLLPRAKAQESVLVPVWVGFRFGVLGPCSAVGTFVGEALLISVFAREAPVLCSCDLPGDSCSGPQQTWVPSSLASFNPLVLCVSLVVLVLWFCSAFPWKEFLFVHPWGYNSSQSQCQGVSTLWMDREGLFRSPGTPGTAAYSPCFPGPFPQRTAWSFRRQTRPST